VLAHIHTDAEALTVDAARALAADGWPMGVQRIRLMATTRDRALVAMGTPSAVVGDRRPVLLFELKGRFTVPILAPAGSPQTAKGTYLLVVMDPSTGEPMDSGVGEVPAHMTGNGWTLVERG
jgi:hypothetical protein